VVVVPDEPREPMVSGSSSVSAVSQAVCGAGAVAARKELYQHVAQLRYGEVQLLSLVYFVTKVLTVSMFSYIWSWFCYFEFIFFYFKHHNKKKLHFLATEAVSPAIANGDSVPKWACRPGKGQLYQGVHAGPSTGKTSCGGETHEYNIFVVGE